MSYFGIPRGRNKALSTVRLVINNANPTNNASLYLDSGSPTTVTFYPGTWLELFASTSTNVNMIEIFDSNGFTQRLGTGAAAAEVDLLLDFPGGNGNIPVRINSGTRVVLQPITNPVVGAEVDINWYD
jgi:hypothetical protein